MEELELLNIVSSILMTFASATYIIAVKKQPRFRIWAVSFTLMAVGFDIKYLLPFIINYVPNVIFGIASFISLKAAYNDYSFYIKKPKNPNAAANDAKPLSRIENKIPLILVASFAEIFTRHYVEVILLVITIITAYFEFKVYASGDKRIHLFIFGVFLVSSINVFIYLLDALGYDWSKPFEAGTTLMTSVLILASGGILLLEHQLEMATLKLQQNLERTRNRLIENEERAETLAQIIENLTYISQSVNSASENITAAQQEISEGTNNQVIAINQIRKEIEKLYDITNDVLEKVHRINIITENVREIANKTNMLALNAAIEAARAGPYGKGFNTVAEQIRDLSAGIKAPLKNSDRLLKEIDEIAEIERTKALSVLNEIREIANVAEEISAGTEESTTTIEEQTASIENINDIVTRLNSIAQSFLEEIKSKNAAVDNEDLSESETEVEAGA